MEWLKMLMALFKDRPITFVLTEWLDERDGEILKIPERLMHRHMPRMRWHTAAGGT